MIDPILYILILVYITFSVRKLLRQLSHKVFNGFEWFWYTIVTCRRKPLRCLWCCNYTYYTVTHKCLRSTAYGYSCLIQKENTHMHSKFLFSSAAYLPHLHRAAKFFFCLFVWVFFAYVTRLIASVLLLAHAFFQGWSIPAKVRRQRSLEAHCFVSDGQLYPLPFVS